MKNSRMKKIISGTVSAMMIAASVPFSSSAAVGNIDTGSVTEGNVGGGFGGWGGNGGGGTSQVLWRCMNGVLDGYETKVVALMVGTNNRHDSAEDVARGIKRIVAVIREKQPGAKILLSPILPRFAREDGGGWLSRVGESAFAVCHAYEILI